MTMRDKVVGMLLGVGIGDALGRCCEGMDYQSVKSTYGKVDRYIIQNGWPVGRKLGIGTDDTSLSLIVGEGLLLSGGKPEMDSQVQAHVKAYPESYAWGKKTWEVIRRLRYGVPWQSAGAKDAFGNGCPMKISSTAILLLRDIPGATDFIASLCSMTHQTSVAVSAGLAQAFGLAYCLNADPGTFNAAEFVQVVVNASRIGKNYFAETLTDEDITERLALCDKYADYPPERCNAEISGRCYVYCSLPFTYMFFLRNPTSIESLYEVVSMGADTDTNGSMVAALLGALNGTSIFPAHLVNELEAKDQLVEVANRLCDLFKIE